MNPETQMTRLKAPKPKPENQSKPTFQARGKVLEDKDFTFDNSFWSHDENDNHFASQEDVYSSLGEEFLDHNFQGYHTCIFAYGQTGSGKSYTMMGTPDNPGLIPKTCEDLFQRIECSQSPRISYNVRISYFEVYNEHVRDLLGSRTGDGYFLRIRESPSDGPYVKDLTETTVKSYPELMKLMEKGDAARTTASTKMNDTSSRSHAVFTITLKQIHHDLSTDETTERTARIRLVDLAGSERANRTEASGQRLREGGNINKSLTALGRVIACLADSKSPTRHGRKGSKDVVPYRDSVLTWLLKDSLGGNSKTAMIACIAPADYDETLSTLRYADQAKRIRTCARVNQDHLSAAERDKQIAEMAETIRNLQLDVSAATAHKRQNENQDERIEEYQKMVEQLHRLMEENNLVADSKFRQVQSKKEAAERHVQLLKGTVKELQEELQKREVQSDNIHVEKRPRPKSQSLYSESPSYYEDKENENMNDDMNENYMEEFSPWPAADDDRYGEGVQEGVDLMKDMGLFRSRLASDLQIFVSNARHQKQRNIHKRRVLGNTSGN